MAFVLSCVLSIWAVQYVFICLWQSHILSNPATGTPTLSSPNLARGRRHCCSPLTNYSPDQRWEGRAAAYILAQVVFRILHTARKLAHHEFNDYTFLQSLRFFCSRRMSASDGLAAAAVVIGIVQIGIGLVTLQYQRKTGQGQRKSLL